MATAAKFDAYERRTELEKHLLEQKLKHAISREKTAQTKYQDLVNGKSSLAEHLERELHQVYFKHKHAENLHPRMPHLHVAWWILWILCVHVCLQAKGDLADVNKQTASAEVAAMQKVGAAQELARQQVEDVKEHQRIKIAQEAANGYYILYIYNIYKRRTHFYGLWRYLGRETWRCILSCYVFIYML